MRPEKALYIRSSYRRNHENFVRIVLLCNVM